MKLAKTEVYEVATFYHHFDVVKEGEAAPPAITVRVCESLSCEHGRRASSCCDKLPACSGADVRVLRAPCIGRCEQAPAAVVGQNRDRPCDRARDDRRRSTQERRRASGTHAYIDYARYRARRRLRTLAPNASPASATSSR